jgi:hypothetical protein
MKNIKFKIAGLLTVLFFASCAKTEFDVVPKEELMGDSLQTTYTINQLLTEFKSNYDAYTDTLAYSADLFTTKKVESANEVVISGVVTSTDIDGNVYKNLVVQELAPDGMAIKISIDASGLSGNYPLGQRVWIRCNDLFVGNYAQSPLIGMRYINYTKLKYKASIDSTIYRVEPGRLAFPIAKQVIHAYGVPDPSLVKADTLTIAQIKAAGSKLFNKLVCIPNAFFTGKGANNGYATNITDEELIFAPSTNGVGYPQSREIQDGTGSMFISTSEYAKFAGKKIPTSNYRGYITAIVGWYNDKDKNASSTKTYHQLTLRTINDLGTGFEGYFTNN